MHEVPYRGINAHLCGERTSTSLPNFCGAIFSLASYADVVMVRHAYNSSSQWKDCVTCREDACAGG